jgi:hypothetical protein
MAVLALMATAAIPAIGSLGMAGRVQMAEVSLGGFLSQAQTTAVSKRTWVRVAIAANPAAAGKPASISVVSWRSLSGRNLESDADWLEESQAEPTHRKLTLRGFLLDFERLPAGDNSLESFGHTTAYGGQIGGTQQFTMDFSPTGECHIRGTLPRSVAFGILPEHEGRESNRVLLRIQGSTGRAKSLRAEEWDHAISLR